MSAGEMDATLKLAGNTTDRILKLWQQFKGAALVLGNRMLPYVNAGLDLIDHSIRFVKMHLNEIGAAADAAAMAMGVMLLYTGGQAVVFAAGWVVSMVSSLGATFLLQYGLLAVRTALFSIPIVGWLAAAVAGFVYLYQSSDTFRATLVGIGSVFLALLEPVKLLGLAIANLFNPAAFAANLAQFINSVKNLDLSGTYTKGYDASITAPSEAAYNSAKGAAWADSMGLNYGPKVPKSALEGLSLPKSPVGPGGPGGGPPGPLKDGLKAVNDGGRQVRNVTVNINGGLVKEVKIINGTGQGGKEEFADFIKETIIRAVNGAEQALT